MGDILNSVFHVFLILSIQYKIRHAKSDKNKIHYFYILMATSNSVQQQLSFLWGLDFQKIQGAQKQLFISFWDIQSFLLQFLSYSAWVFLAQENKSSVETPFPLLCPLVYKNSGITFEGTEKLKEPV